MSSPDKLNRIEITADQIDAVKSGTKKITIREGTRGYRYGDCVIFCVEPSFEQTVQIISTHVGRVREIYRHEALEEGVEDVDALLVKMQSFYPDMTLDSIVTVVRWK